VTFGKPVIANQVTQFKLANMEMKTEMARAAVINCFNHYYAGLPYSEQAAIAKCYATDIAVECAIEAIQLHGGYGYSREYPVEKLLRDAKILQIYEGTNEVQRIVIAGQVTR
jgi:butyryl-CoA dehydrogenase